MGAPNYKPLQALPYHSGNGAGAAGFILGNNTRAFGPIVLVGIRGRRRAIFPLPQVSGGQSLIVGGSLLGPGT